MPKRMTMALFSGSIDKLTAAGVVLTGAAADDMDVDIYVLLQGARAFRKDVAADATKLEMAENPQLKQEFLDSLKKLNVNPWLEFFREAKEITKVKIHVCGLAGKIWGAEKMEDFNELVDDIVGISEYITAAQESDVHLFI
ncbi:DsrE family protein [Prolixibacter sp. NT017]|uniref:DsrE family protein n=1 Tax=Prolixibacter sp. NT017 TaxID=2652390 RepID=UPI0012766D5A|nr:DsrE/DsrF/DrsH-like family protein [Prolixibacter sp. NT017]GET25127.1 peroxiredoxin [Prolixibacter sp. NT017]